MIKTTKDMGALIKDARMKAGLSQSALAAMIKTTQGWVSEVENGKPTAEIGMVLKVINALGLRLDFRSGDQISTQPTRPGIADVLERTRPGYAKTPVAGGRGVDQNKKRGMGE